MGQKTHDLPGYQLGELIHESATSAVYKGVRLKDRTRVIVKCSQRGLTAMRQHTRARNEYELLKAIDSSGIIRIHELIAHEGRLSLVFEEFPGIALKQWIGGGEAGLEEKLEIGAGVADIIADVHRAGIIHKDINSQNLLYDPGSKRCKLIDFGLATRLQSEESRFQTPGALEGTLAYIAPEQTGRTSRSVDYRADLYSLGVTLYELFSGSLPFEGSDPLEIVHFHIAGRALPLWECDAGIPEVVSDIVARLLEKAPELRYQSAVGVAADLRRCLDSLRTDGVIERFPLGADDVVGKFERPHRLYGREDETRQLLDSFQRVCNGSVESVLVAGQAGVGKTLLVHEMHESITRRKAYFASGKFDQLQRDKPLSAFLAAMQELVEQLLTENEDTVQRWKEAIQTAVGHNGQVIVDVIPSLELIIGPQPPVPELEPLEAQNRFTLAFRSFIQVFGKKSHPLVLFLDDMQWADQASLNLVSLILTAPDTESLLVVQAYRDGDQAAVSPLLAAVEEQKRAGVTVLNIELAPLASHDVVQMVADALRTDLAGAEALATVIQEKTLGNPFFIDQFLQTLYDEELIAYDAESRAFRYDLAAIGSAAITENVAELLAAKLDKLPAGSRDVLRHAAAIGNRFDIETLALICNRTVSGVAEALQPALAQGLILPVSGLEMLDPHSLDAPLVYRRFDFLHDRVQQAAYAMIAAAERPALHLAIGRALVREGDGAQREARLFDIVHHMILGLVLIDDPGEKLRLAEDCLAAGRKAKKSTAYSLAVRFYRNAGKLLGDSGWREQAKLTFEAHYRLAEALCLDNASAEALTIIDATDERAPSLRDRGKLRTLKIVVHMAMGRMPEALACGRQAVRLFGVELSNDTAETARMLEAEIAAILAETEKIGIEQLLDLPVMRDETIAVTMEALMQCLPAAFQSDQQQYALFCCKMVRLSLDNGNNPLSARAYGSFAALASSAFGDHPRAYRFARLGVDLAHKLQDPTVLSGVYFLSAMFAAHWMRPIDESIELFRKSVQYGLQHGDHQHAAYSIARCISHEQFRGKLLDELHPSILSALELLHRIGDANNVHFLNPRLGLINWLRGERPGGNTLGTAAETEEQITATIIARGNRSFEADWQIQRTIQRYFAGDYEASLDFGEQAEQLIPFSAGFITRPEHNFYYSLTLASLLTTAGPEAAARYQAKLEENQQRLQAWAEQCPENLMHMYLLVEAERARLAGDRLAAMDLYDRAIAAAVQQGFVNIEAVAAERAAAFWYGVKKSDFGDIYLDRALHAYRLWGADGKAADLRRAWRHDAESGGGTSASKASTGASQHGDALDLATVLKSSQAIAGEIRLDRLLATMIEIILASAGGEFAALILKTDDEFRIQGLKTPAIDEAEVMLARPLNRSSDVSRGIVNYVIRTREEVVLEDPARQGRFRNDEYVRSRKPRSVLCAPIIYKGELNGVIYIENNQVAGAFTPERLESVNILLAQIAVSIENATLYAHQAEQTREIETANLALTKEVSVRRRAEFELGRYRDRLEELVAKRTEELQKAQGRLVDMSRRAGMAEVASGVLHNVGNVMNSVNVGLSVTREAVRALRVDGVGSVCDLLDRQGEGLGDYLAKDPAGQKIPRYLRMLGEELVRDRQATLARVDEVLEHLEHMKEIIAAQQSYARTGGVTEACTIEGIVETALAIGQLPPDIRVERKLESLAPVIVDRHQILQILVNLISNARHALHDGAGHEPTLAIRVQADADEIRIEVSDNGAGIAPENLPQVFNHGFTTKRDGHGFGLHNCANAAQQMGGSLTASSEGRGTGACFTLSLPVEFVQSAVADVSAA